MNYYKRVLLTIDIGTSVFKSALWSLAGERLAFAACPLSMVSSGGLRHEAESGQWLRAFEDCRRRLAAAGGLERVQAIVISGNGPSLTPVLGMPEFTADGLCVAAAPARLWLDRRAEAAAAEVSLAAGDFVDAGFYLPKALGIKNDEPELYARTRFFLGCPEFLAFALTARARTVFPSEGFDRWFWNDDILEWLKLDAAKFPPFIRPGESFGALLPEAAARFGLLPGIPVVAGGPDFFVSILGAGVVSPGQVCDRAGTSEGINVCTEQRINDRRLMSYSHPVKPYWNLSGIISTTGKAIEWGLDFLGLHSYADFFALAESAGPGAGGLVFLPYLAGERAPIWDSSARGVLRGLSLATGRREFARSLVEGICFAIRDVITVMEECGAQVGELRLSGGAAENDFLNQLKADITGKETLVPVQKESELLGLAIIGACALGAYRDFSSAAGALVRIEQGWRPDAGKTALYGEIFARYRETYQNLKGT
jgi:xylulokinase